MLIIDENSVYEIDEECLKKYGVQKECQLPNINEYHQENRNSSKSQKERGARCSQ